MIPLTLKLKNFLSYSSDLQTIDFKPYPIICLSGKNGHGKSAMLDSITWAIWGQARKGIATPKPDQGVVRIGQSRVHVSLDFEVKGQVYRVSRDFFNSGMKSGAALEFQIFDPTTLSYKSLTDKTIKDTQAKIINTIGLDFETFINTSFFKQGCSNEFSKKTPKERKQIICSILGLEKYDQVSSKALGLSKEVIAKSLLIQNINSRLSKEIECYEQIIQELVIAKKVLIDKQAWMLAKNKRENELAKEMANLESQQKACKIFEDKLNAWQEKRALLAKLNKEVSNKVSFQSLQETLKILTLEQSQLNTKHTALQKGSNELFALKTNLANQRENFAKLLEHEKEEFRNKIDQAKGEAHKLILLHDQNALIIKNHVSQLEISKKELKEVQASLEQNISNKTEEESICPTCKQKVSGQTMLQCLAEEQKNLELKKQSLFKACGEKEKEISSLEQILENQTKKISFLKDQYQELVAQYKQKFDPALFQNLFQAQEGISGILTQIEQLEKNQNSFLEIQKKLAINSSALKSVHEKLEAAIDGQKIETQRHNLYIELLKELADILTKQKSFKFFKCELLKNSSNISQEMFLLQNDLEQGRKEIDSLNQTIGRLEHEKLKLEGFSKEVKENSEQIAELEQEAMNYQILANAYGKNGIQALIVESVIPEIEFEANKILSTLSQDNSRIYIEPLKDLKKGGFKESLDIKIFDSAGVRSYEMFSGGEAFRIDFALRIGISKLLAKRAGAQLQTLIIDEGFGSQDAEGLARLIEGIHMIKNDFKKIIIVSHLSEFKDEFPVHFVVNKTSAGSTIQVQTRM